MAAKKKPVARARAKKARAARPKRPSRSAKTKPRARRAAKPAARTSRRSKVAAGRASAPAKTRVDAADLVRALERKVRRLGAARRTLEQRLTAAVQEIGTLRHFELRVSQLEEEIRRRDAELAALRSNGAAPSATP